MLDPRIQNLKDIFKYRIPISAVTRKSEIHFSPENPEIPEKTPQNIGKH